MTAALWIIAFSQAMQATIKLRTARKQGLVHMPNVLKRSAKRPRPVSVTEVP